MSKSTAFFHKHVKGLDHLRHDTNVKVAKRTEQAIKSRMGGKYAWQVSQNGSPICRVNANTKSEAWSKLAKIGLNRRLGKFELTKVDAAE